MTKIKESAKIVSLEELLFAVRLVNNPATTNTEYSKIVVGDTYERGRMELNYCSKRYELIPNTDIFPNIESVLFGNGIDFKVTYRHIDHVQFYADYIITDKKYEYNVHGSDNIKPMISVQHSYNGLTKYVIQFGYFRMICSNGLVIPVKEMDMYNLSITGKHTAIIAKSFQMLNELLINFANNAKQITETITKKFEVMGDTYVPNPKDRILEVLTGTGVITPIDNSKFNTVDYVLGIASKEANDTSLTYDGKINDWLIYNAINQYIHDDELNKMLPEKRREKDSKTLEYMLDM